MCSSDLSRFDVLVKPAAKLRVAHRHIITPFIIFAYASSITHLIEQLTRIFHSGFRTWFKISHCEVIGKGVTQSLVFSEP